jgi:hypothetical protein
MRFLIDLLRREFLGSPLYGWLIMLAIIAFMVWGVLYANEPGGCHLMHGEFACGP